MAVPRREAEPVEDPKQRVLGGHETYGSRLVTSATAVSGERRHALCPPLSDNCGPQGHHALVNPVFGRARNVGGAVTAPSESVHPTALDLPPQGIGDGFGRSTLNAETMVANGVDQLGN